jgi:catalase (peroxidase I)
MCLQLDTKAYNFSQFVLCGHITFDFMSISYPVIRQSIFVEFSGTFERAWYMMHSFILSQVICLGPFLVALNGSKNSNVGNSTNETTTEDTVMTSKPLIWAMGLILTELVSVLLIAWSSSIVYRLAFTYKITLNV